MELDLEVAVSLLSPPLRARLAECRTTPPGTTLDALLTAQVPELDAVRRAATAARVGRLAHRALRQSAELGLRLLGRDDPCYPSLLGHVPDAPRVLWWRGQPSVLARPAVAIVGSRAALMESLAFAHGLARDLAARGLVVVSGLARGIDSAAHRGALECGPTVAVCGTGIDRTYPPEHRGLADAIAANGVVVTEFPPGTPPLAHHFPRRNRIIAGLSVAVVVVEAGWKSGALGTARCALEQGREVMAVPGLVAGGRNRGGHGLIRDGATLVESAEDVMAALPAHVLAHLGPSPAADAAPRPSRPDDAVLQALPPGVSRTFEELVEATGWVAHRLAAHLTGLELDGEVERLPGGRFLRANRKW
jgi:DNA processing protein